MKNPIPSGSKNVSITQQCILLDWMDKQVITINYTNWKGIRRVRKILPINLWFGVTEYHNG